jgi:hypothetical protein
MVLAGFAPAGRHRRTMRRREREVAMNGITEADVKAMSRDELSQALRLIHVEIKTREEGGFAEVVREALAGLDDAELRTEIALGGGAVRLTFPADYWDDGFFYDESRGELGLHDGGTADVDFCDTLVHDALTELSLAQRREQSLDRYSILVVDLLTGDVRHEVRA